MYQLEVPSLLWGLTLASYCDLPAPDRIIPSVTIGIAGLITLALGFSKGHSRDDWSLASCDLKALIFRRSSCLVHLHELVVARISPSTSSLPSVSLSPTPHLLLSAQLAEQHFSTFHLLRLSCSSFIATSNSEGCIPESCSLRSALHKLVFTSTSSRIT